MTEVALNIRSCYLAGPMRGLPEFNFPEFHKQAAWLRANGWKVFSPAERDEADPALNGDWGIDVAGRGLDYFMQFDLAAVCQTEAVVVMEGWEKSQGARLEAVTAVEVGHPVFEIVMGWNEDDWGRRLESVNPAYIRLVFFGQGMPDSDIAEKAVMAEEGVAPWPEDIDIIGNDVWDQAVTHDPSLAEGNKAMPIATGVLDYFPAALLEVSKVSKAGNDKHNPGQPLHHARGKSTGHADSLLRHLVNRGSVDEETGQLHSAEVAWRALAMLQQELEDAGAPLARGARLT
jgi:hypothetical protein